MTFKVMNESSELSLKNIDRILVAIKALPTHFYLHLGQ